LEKKYQKRQSNLTSKQEELFNSEVKNLKVTSG